MDLVQANKINFGWHRGQCKHCGLNYLFLYCTKSSKYSMFLGRHSSPYYSRITPIEPGTIYFRMTIGYLTAVVHSKYNKSLLQTRNKPRTHFGYRLLQASHSFYFRWIVLGYSLQSHQHTSHWLTYLAPLFFFLFGYCDGSRIKTLIQGRHAPRG